MLDKGAGLSEVPRTSKSNGTIQAGPGLVSSQDLWKEVLFHSSSSNQLLHGLCLLLNQVVSSWILDLRELGIQTTTA